MFVKSKNKKRLFVAVYPSGQGTGTYHWALLVGPKVEGDAAAGQRYHVKNQPSGLAGIAKIVNEKRLIKTLAKVPVDPPDWKGKADGSEPRWTCRVWVIAALEAIRDDGKIVGTNCLDDIDGPNGIIERVKAFVASQIAGKRFSPPHDAMAPKPLLNMLTGEELYL